jgi:hypothetical protein
MNKETGEIQKQKETRESKLERWFLLREKIVPLVELEMELRKEIFADFFSDPKEGTNTFVLPGGWHLKGKHVINRNVDEAMLAVKKELLLEKGIPVGQIIAYKPKLEVKSYRALSDEQKLLFDQVLDIKPGSPQLEIVKPAKK